MFPTFKPGKSTARRPRVLHPQLIWIHQVTSPCEYAHTHLGVHETEEV
jgi:hypothetical protein